VRQDILMLSVGSWYFDHYRDGIARLMGHLQDELKDAKAEWPMLIWREPLPQHWPGNRMGQGKAGCNASSAHEGHAARLQRVLYSMMNSSRMHLLNSHDPLLPRADEHPALHFWHQRSKVDFSSSDCTHYLPRSSATRFLGILTFNAIQLAVAEERWQHTLPLGCPNGVLELVSLKVGIAGFGHLFVAAMFAMHLARVKGLRFVIEDSYWDGHKRNPRNYTSWAWSLTPAFHKASELRTASEKMMRPGQLGTPLSYRAMLKRSVCTGGAEHWFRVDTASNKGCPGATNPGGFCHSSLPGILDRSLTAMPASDAFRLPKLEAAASEERSIAPARVVWHIRVGDYKSPISDDALVGVRAMIDGSLTRRVAEHCVVTEDERLLARMWPRFNSLSRGVKYGHGTGDSTFDDLLRMANADVLVSTGSSFSLAAAALAPMGQVHLSFPPKEAWGNWLSTRVFRNLTEPSTRRTGAYKTSFMGRNTVPVDGEGRPFADYQQKFKHMMNALDGGGRPSADVSTQSFEHWLT